MKQFSEISDSTHLHRTNGNQILISRKDSNENLILQRVYHCKPWAKTNEYDRQTRQVESHSWQMMAKCQPKGTPQK